MADVDVVLSERARIFLEDVATATERSRFWLIVDQLCASPAIDDRTRFPFGTGAAIYSDGTFWIIYRVLNAYTIAIDGIGTES